MFLIKAESGAGPSLRGSRGDMAARGQKLTPCPPQRGNLAVGYRSLAAARIADKPMTASVLICPPMSSQLHGHAKAGA
jgi:hypothetical protein